MTSIRISSRKLLRSSCCFPPRNSSQSLASPRFFTHVSITPKPSFTTNAKHFLRLSNETCIRQKITKRTLATDTLKAASSEAKKQSKTAGDIFLDNIGTVFLSAIGLLIATLVRSSYGTSNKTNLRKRIESETVLDPFEIDDLRTANDQISPETFREIYISLRRTHGWTLSQKVDYQLFVSGVMQVMKGMKGDAFTIQLGHLLDRVVADVTEKGGKEEVRMFGEDGLEFSLLLVALTLAMNGSIRDRVEVLYDILKDGNEEQSEIGDVNLGNKAPAVKEDDVIKMIGYLQKTCQLVPDAQIVESDVKYPAQEYKLGSPVELVHLGKEMKKEELGDDVLTSRESEWTCDDFHHLLRSRSVCAWGECYVKAKGLAM